MKYTFVAFFLIGSGVVMGTEYYSDIYDTVDVDAILKSERLTNQYISCLLDKGPCTADGRSLKHILPDAIATQCEKCNDKQQQLARKVCKLLRDKKPEAWSSFLEKYDPDGKYIVKFEEFIDRV